MFRNQTKYFFIILIITSLACAVPSFNTPPQAIVNTETSIPVFTETSLPTSAPTFTFTPTLIRPTQPIRTSTQPATITSTPLFTINLFTGTPTISNITPDAVIISVSRPTNCRVGPGAAYEIAGTLLVDETAIVLGRDPSNLYWYIPNPDPGIEYCWVWGEYASFTGVNMAVPVLTPLPTPTSTATALPDIKFDVRGRGSNKCNGDFWIKVEVTNTSEETKLTFRSIRVEVEDTDTSTTRFNSSDGFILRDGCNGYIQTETIEYGKSFIVSGPNFPYNLNGHTLRVYVTVCTEKDLQGICRTIKIGVKP